ncbi:MAG TPA: hypothetical protein VHP63_08490, partial [candidate division Zixibacteria bacterium]|nr:hypothetical protein [candidate division Zixibacteria bacterium]
MDVIYQKAVQTFVRFPFTLTAAIVGTICGIILIEAQGGDECNYIEKIMLVCSLGLPLFTAFVCVAERKGWTKQKNLMLQAGGAILLLGYYFTLPPDIDEPLYHLLRYLLLNIAFHFMVAFLPYLDGRQVQGFWQYN